MKKEDLEKYGYTVGCPGCRAANRGTAAANHTEERRKRIGEELEKVGDQRLERETGTLLEYLEEEESKKKRARASEGNGDGKPSASSSGPAVAEEAVPSSRGGVPMAMDSGDSVQEIVERKIGDREQGGGEDSKEKKN